MNWFPDPILLEGGEHFRSYQDSKDKDTDETDRPTFKVLDRAPKPKRPRKRAHSPEQNVDTETEASPGSDDDENINIEDDINIVSLYCFQFCDSCFISRIHIVFCFYYKIGCGVKHRKRSNPIDGTEFHGSNYVC